MNSDTLTEVSIKRMDDLTERCQFLVSTGRQEDANVLGKEIMMIARALDNNDPFLVLHPPEGFDVYSFS